jgi:hypothetical protein
VSLQGLLTSAGLVFVGVGVKALTDGHRVWGTILLVSGIAVIAVAFRNWAMARAFTHDPPFLVVWRKVPAAEVLPFAAPPAATLETLTFSVPSGKGIVRNLIFEPLAALNGVLEMDPPEILFLHSHQPVTCTIVCVELRTSRAGSSGYGLQYFLQRYKGGRMEVVVRYTDALGMRRRLPFNVEIMGANKHVEWVPQKALKADPSW